MAGGETKIELGLKSEIFKAIIPNLPFQKRIQ
jgi:hypothetical protein